jgi:hypothetical protein
MKASFPHPVVLALLLGSCSSFPDTDAQLHHVPLLPAALVPEAPSTEPAEPSSGPSGWAVWNALRGDAYDLDDTPRMLEDERQRVTCQPDAMVSYSGSAVRYSGPVMIDPAFRERLERFEQVVVETATEIYGRPPRRIRHFGAYSCRSSRNRTYRLSEHALGNAIDVAGFDFGPGPKGAVSTLPKPLRGTFEVRVARHWAPKAGGTTAEIHARFLRLLLERLQERENVFRGVIGPGHPGHDDHFHFDMSPWRFVRP